MQVADIGMSQKFAVDGDLNCIFLQLSGLDMEDVTLIGLNSQ